MKDPANLRDLNYADTFQYLWPTNVDGDVAAINIKIVKENHSRNERYQRPIRAVSKSEYIMFATLIIGVAVHSDKGEKLWNAVSSNRKKQRLQHNTYYGKYMKPWRFKEIKLFLPEIIVAIQQKEEIGNNSLHRLKSMDTTEKIEQLHLIYWCLTS